MELSADRVVFLCCESLDAVQSAFFKLISGIPSSILIPDFNSFQNQFEYLVTASEARENPEKFDHSLDAFSTHPYGSIRARALSYFANSVTFGGNFTLEEVEPSLMDDMDLMEPFYLEDDSKISQELRNALKFGSSILAHLYHTHERTQMLKYLLAARAMECGIMELSKAEEELLKIENIIQDALLLQRKNLLRYLVIIDSKDLSYGLNQLEKWYFSWNVSSSLIHHTAKYLFLPF